MKVIKFLIRFVCGAIAIFLIAGFVSTAYQVISGNVICCDYDPVKLGMPVGFYLVLVPIVVMVFLARVILRNRK